MVYRTDGGNMDIDIRYDLHSLRQPAGIYAKTGLSWALKRIWVYRCPLISHI